MKNFVTLFLILVIIGLIGVGCGSDKQKPVPVATKEEAPKAQSADTVVKDEAKRITTRKDASDIASVRKSDKLELTSDIAGKEEKEEQPKEENVYQKTRGMDWRITPERREVIEKEIPEAKGFVDSAPIVEKIIAGQITSKEERVKLFLEAAKDQYIYFAAQTNPNPFNDNASLNIIFGEGALTPDFMMIQLRSPKNYDHKKYISMYGGTGYVTAFVGKLAEKDGNLELDPVYDVYLPGYIQ